MTEHTVAQAGSLEAPGASRPRWRPSPAMTFGAVLLVLLVGALWATVFPPRRLGGLPDDPDLFAAASELRGRIAIPLAGLRLESALTGPVAPDSRAEADQEARLARAEHLVERAKQRLGRDPRWGAARAVLDLARHRYADAARRYRAALDRAPRYSEARLGLGLALALQAELERNPLVQRRLRFKAIAQWTAVEPGSAEHDEALYDRVLMLEQVGRGAEAKRLTGGST